MLASVSLLTYGAYRWRVRSVESQFNAVLAERNRIAREIHDTLAQGFVAVSVQLEVVARLLSTSTEAARSHLEQARNLTRDCLAEARSSIWNLRSQGTTQNDLASALTQAAERITANSSVKARVQVSGTFRPMASENSGLRLNVLQSNTEVFSQHNPFATAIETRSRPGLAAEAGVQRLPPDLRSAFAAC